MAGREVLLFCDATTGVGMGHLMRCLALAQHAQSRGWVVTVQGDIASSAVDAAGRIAPGVHVRPSGPGVQAVLTARGHDVLHLDTYASLADVRGPDLRGAAPLLSNMQDGAYGERPADLAIDGTLGAQHAFWTAPGVLAARLVGIDAAVIRQQVLDQRYQRDHRDPPSDRPRVLVVMGGTDPQGATAKVLGLLGEVGMPLDVTVVDPAGRPEVCDAAAASPHRVDVLGFVDDLPALASAHDVAISAAGTSVWDFACMGVPMAIVCVVDNQRDGYRRLVADGLALGLGEPGRLAPGESLAELGELLTRPARRARQRDRLRAAVDGLGTWRIVSAWEQLLEVPMTAAPHDAALVAREARLDDADLLRSWRNDRVTRAHSRSAGEVDPEAHEEWLRRSLRSRDRRLLLVEHDGDPVGTVRWDREGATDWVVSITIAPAWRGRGIAASVLAVAEDALDAVEPVRLLADIHQENPASRRLFARSGYLPQLPPDEHGFARFAKWRLQADR
ncbi:GNAT family N-acetyltransferase [Microbacterium sp. 22242]|uniref:GNAT family N-acetyltransferase n=1 Tax=Microbacterium sp. 22242 TaxID=3453896 RepID=UPI003F877B3A